MRKSLLILSLVALTCGSAGARSLTPSEALARAMNSGDNGSSTQHRAPSRAIPMMTVGSAETPALYVFDQGSEGYLIVSADDVAAPVLGYSDTGTFDPDSIPDNLRWWLGQYQSQIEAAVRDNAGEYSKVSRAERAPIEPLLKSTWDQGAPYNNYAPSILGQRTVTGCVATAMAQVMYYHKWPEKFNALFDYEWTAGKTTLKWSAPNVQLDWANMLPSYKNVSYTPSQGNAVANLMKACGYSVNMNYNISSKGGSGAVSSLVAGALANYFKYDKGVYNAYRPFYTLTEWENLIYDNLTNVGPVVYSGDNDTSGHCFVCDGYSKDGYFHFNWGWSGVSNGYYLLSALDPELQGIGGSTSGFNNNQEITLGIKKAEGFSSMKKIFLCFGDFSGEVVKDGKNTYIKLVGPFFNLSNGSLTGQVGARFVMDNGTTQDIFIAQSNLIEAQSGYSAYTISGSFPSGSGKLYPIIKYSGSETAVIPCHADQAGYLDYRKSGSTITVSTPEVGRYSITDMKLETPMYLNSKFLVSGKAVWTGKESVMTPVYGLLLSGTGAETVVAFGSTMPVEFLPGGEPLAFDYVSSRWLQKTIINDRPTLTEANVNAGNYYFAFGVEQGYNYDGFKLISTPIQVKIQPEPMTTSISVLDFQIKDANNVNPENFSATINLYCQTGYFFGNIIVAVFDKVTSANVGQFYSNAVPVEANKQATLTVKGVLTNVIPGKTYIVQLFDSKGQYLQKSKEIVISKVSGIDDITADSDKAVSVSPNPASDYTVISASQEILRVNIASLGGAMTELPTEINGNSARVDVSALAPGLYVGRVVTTDGVLPVKIIKK